MLLSTRIFLASAIFALGLMVTMTDTTANAICPAPEATQ